MFLTLVVTGTAMMAATIPTDMAIGAGLTTVGFALFHHGLGQVNDAEAGLTGTFHLSNGSHSVTPKQ
ncbi:hypothetical protein OLK001_09830 [Synechocystis sp. LKSZ1]